MNRKQLDAIVDSIIEQVAKDNELSKEEAITFVGVALRKGQAAFLQTVNVPALTVAAS